MASRKKHTSTAKQRAAKSPQVQSQASDLPEKKTRTFRFSLPDPKWALHVLLAIALILILISRVLYLPIPFDRDEGAYGYLGWMALSGGVPYVDFYEMKPPLLFYSYAVIIALFGKSTIGLHLAATVIHVVCTWFVYQLGHRLWNSRGAGAIAAIVFLLFGMNTFATGHAMESEHVVLLFALPGLLYTLKGASTDKWIKLFIGGILLACSALVKQNGIFFCAAGLCIVLLHVLRPGKWKSKQSLMGVLSFALGGIIPVVLCLLFLLIVGALDEFWYWIYQHPQRYLSSLDTKESMRLFERGVTGILRGYELLVLLGFVSLLFLPFGKTMEWRSKAALFLLLLLSACAVIPGWRFYGHYWLCLFPAFALLYPSMFIAIPGMIKGPTWKSISQYCVMLILFSVIGLHTYLNWNRYFHPDFKRELMIAHKGNYFYAHMQIGDILNAEMKPQDQLMVLGSEPQLYLYTKKKSPTRHFYTSFTSKVIPDAELWEQEVIDDIKESNPEYMVFFVEPFAWMFEENSPRKLYKWAYSLVTRNYTPIAYVELKPYSETEIITGAAAQDYEPTSKHYVIISKRKT